MLTHTLEHVTENGLPEKEYNKSLMDFDLYVCDYLEKSEQGITVLIETYAGERNYYCYGIKNYPITTMLSDLNRIYPMHKITIETRTDEQWKFLNDYRILYQW